jgi:hypothetical protein
VSFQAFDLQVSTEWIVTINAFCDESGKFHDRSVVSFGGIAAPSSTFNYGFCAAWGGYLHHLGLEELSLKHVFNHHLPLSDKRPALGIDERLRTLMPFVRFIRKHMHALVCVSVDCIAFKGLPSHQKEVLGRDPVILAFTRALVGLVDIVPTDDHLSFVCDEDEGTVIGMYKQYRKIKRHYPDARSKLRGISFADDRHLFGLQAADLISGLVRHESGLRFNAEAYAYQPLFAELVREPDTNDAMLYSGIALCGKEKLSALGEKFEKTVPHSLREASILFNED